MRGFDRGVWLTCFASALVLLAASPALVHAAWPGSNGKLVIERPTAPHNFPGVWTVDPDGTDLVQLTNTTHWSENRTMVSPDGQADLLPPHRQFLHTRVVPESLAP